MSNSFLTPAKIISGVDALEATGPELARMGKKALVVSDGMMSKLGNLAKVTDTIAAHGAAVSVYAEVNSEPTDLIVVAGVEQYRREDCDFLVAIGGGSPLDTMKAIAVLVTSGGRSADYMGCEISVRTPKMAAVPTTAGTGSEATQFTIITDTQTQVKMLLKGAALLPDLAVVDPQFTMTAPPSVTAATGVDALCHAIEAYTSRKAQPLSDIFALSAAKRIFANLRKAYDMPQDTEARTQMALAATEAGIAFNNSSVTIIHGMSRPIGALFHVAHGLSNAMLMEECLRYAKDGAPGRFATLARHCGFAMAGEPDGVAVDRLLEGISRLLQGLRIPTLRGFGIDPVAFEKVIPKMAKDAFDSGSPSNTRRELGIGDMEALYLMLISK